ncbi:MAG: nitrous oxide reductase family maturation protein NosD [Castellaniella sp.]|uniref:nitrous oxide reductase family maturation protein NosD n=1 Tax=Castellaniella sp. TaxID=1955812 RepID=UPI003C70EB60
MKHCTAPRFSTALAAALILAGGAAQAAVIDVPAGARLQAIIETAAPGDVLRLAPGDYPGNLLIDKPLTLEGPPDRAARILGERQGRTIWVQADDVTIQRLTIRHSGLSLPDMDAGVFLDKTAARAHIVGNDILDNSVGVYLWGSRDALVEDNRIVGNTGLRVNERGNGVTVWNAPGSKVIGNDISEGRDGIFSNNSRENVFSGNTFHHLRYAVHYMYTNDSEVSGNISRGNEIGYAIMFSRRLTVRDNIAADSAHQGLMLNATDDSRIQGNVVVGAEKCVFVYNANLNEMADNHFQDCGTGVHYTGSEGNRIHGNAFVNNQNQVKYVGTRYLEWSLDGRGNYWSDLSAFDLDGNGIGDTAYRPNGLIDQVIWRAPSARLLLNSPAVTIVRWAQSQFPAILPGGVMDSAPLMAPPVPPAWKHYEAKP